MADLRLLNSYEIFDYEVVTENLPTIVKEDVAGKKIEVPGGKKILMKGILQKADTLNQNGRIYPLAVLNREVRNYQKFIIENRALGEIDHPECVTIGYHWLSSQGWLPIEEVHQGLQAVTLNLETGQMELQDVLRGIDQPYRGKMVHVWNAKGTIDQMLTPDHRMLLWDRGDKPYYITAKEFHERSWKGDSQISHSCLKRAGTWVGNDPEMIEVAGQLVDASLWAAFLGIYLAEGHATGILSGWEKPQPSNRSVCVTQKKPDSRKVIGDMMAHLPWHIKEIPQGFKITDSELYSELFKLGSSHNKHIPTYAKQWSPRLLQVMLDWMLLGDGRNRYGYKHECIVSEYCTTSLRLANDVSEIMIKLGHGASIHTYKPGDRAAPDFATTGRMILSENSAPMHIVYMHSSKRVSLDQRFVMSRLEDYDGRVYCMTTPNGNWLARSPTGQVFWTGNSSVVNLKNASHIVREAHIENGTVLGTVEILDKTPSGAILAGLVESKVKLGISSRGVGSTRKQGDYYVVQDDFQLICWDFVSEPSTPGAFMLPEGRQIDKGELRKVFSKSDRIDRILNELLTVHTK